MPANLRIGGYWASEIAGWGDLSWQTTWGDGGGGLSGVKWAMELAPGSQMFRHPALRPNQLVEVMDGPWRIGIGLLDEPEDADGTYSAVGLYREAERYLAFDGSGVLSKIPDEAIDAAIARGLRWTRPASITTNPVIGTDTEVNKPNRLHTLLDAWSDKGGERWYVDNDGAVRRAFDPTTPDYYLAPGLTDLGLSTDGYASTLYGRRIQSSTYYTEEVTDTAAAAAFGRYEDAIDLTPLGPLSAARAEQQLNALMEKGRSRPSFTKTLEVTYGQLMTAGGVPAEFSMVQAGQMVRSLGLVDESRLLDGRTYLDWVIGGTDFTDGEDSISLEPLGLAAVDMQSVLQSMFPRAQFAA